MQGIDMSFKRDGREVAGLAGPRETSTPSVRLAPGDRVKIPLALVADELFGAVPSGTICVDCGSTRTEPHATVSGRFVCHSCEGEFYALACDSVELGVLRESAAIFEASPSARRSYGATLFNRSTDPKGWHLGFRRFYGERLAAARAAGEKC